MSINPVNPYQPVPIRPKKVEPSSTASAKKVVSKGEIDITPRVTSGNEVKLVEGEEILETAVKMIEGAKDTVQVEMYTLGYDKIVDVLAAQARKGVKVQVLLDPTPGWDPEDIAHKNEVKKFLKANGVELLTYPTEKDQIDHVKLLIVDGKIALIGGMNWDRHSPLNTDYDVAVKGPAVDDLSSVFKRDWLISGGKDFALSPAANLPPSQRPRGVEDSYVRVLTTDSESKDIHTAMLENIAKAKRSIHMEAFVLTDQQVIDGLIEAKNRGVDVKVILDSTKPMMFVNKKAMDKLREAGVQARWFKSDVETQEKLHAKVAAFDEDTIIIGSCNFTRNGFSINHEADVEVVNKAVGTAFEKLFNSHWETRSLEEPPDLPDYYEKISSAPRDEQITERVFSYFEQVFKEEDKKRVWTGKRKDRIMSVVNEDESKEISLTQLPSELDSEEQELLTGRIGKAISSMQDFEIIPPPGSSEPLYKVRERLIEEKSKTIQLEGPRLLNYMLGKIEDPQLRREAREILEKAPPQFFSSPSSTSGKYHPADEVISFKEPSKNPSTEKPLDEDIYPQWNKEVIDEVEKLCMGTLNESVQHIHNHNILFTPEEVEKTIEKLSPQVPPEVKQEFTNYLKQLFTDYPEGVSPEKFSQSLELFQHSMKSSGLPLHTARVVKMTDHLCDSLGIKGTEKDQLVTAALLHDITKYCSIEDIKKTPPGETPPWGEHTTGEHGPAAAAWIKGFPFGKDERWQNIAHLVEVHMTRWNKPQPVIPKTPEELVISLADYIVSDKNFYLKI